MQKNSGFSMEVRSSPPPQGTVKQRLQKPLPTQKVGDDLVLILPSNKLSNHLSS